jgi:hypothetical protein
MTIDCFVAHPGHFPLWSACKMVMKAQVTWYRSRGTGHVVLVTWYRSRGTGHVAQVTWHLLACTSASKASCFFALFSANPARASVCVCMCACACACACVVCAHAQICLRERSRSYVCLCVRACMHVCVRARRPRSRGTVTWQRAAVITPGHVTAAPRRSRVGRSAAVT